MDLNDGLWNGAKHIWEVVLAAFSAAISYVMYKAKKHNDAAEADRIMLKDHDTILQVMEERLKNFNDDITEIKDYLKKILFKL